MRSRRYLVISFLGTLVVCFGALAVVLGLGWGPLLGLDLQGGVSVVYKPAHPVSQADLNQAIDIIRNRVDALGVAEPNITFQGSNIVVQLPGVKNARQALDVIGQTAQVYFRPVLCPGVNYSAFPPYSPPKGKQPVPVAPSNICSSSDPNTQFALAAQTPSTPYSQDDPHKTVLLNVQNANGKVIGRYVLGPAVLNGHVIKTAQAVLSSTNEWEVQMTLTSYGANLWDSLGKAYFHKQVAIVLDHVIKSAPEIEPNNSTFQSFNGTAIISGGSGSQFTQQQAVDLATVLQYGALPVQLDRQTVQTVSPTLGKASLHAGLVAGLAGLVLVMLYMIFYYRGLGIVVVLGLGSTAALLWAITSLLGHTKGLALDLSGVTGIIVSVGVTVDSYIVYFERLKDEVRAGKTIRQSVDRGFSRAYRTILAADLVSLIGAVVLYLLSIGPVKGFALFLGISTFLDIFTAYFFTRPLVILLGQSRLFTEARWIGVAPGLAAESQVAVEAKPEPVAVGSRS